MAKNGSKIIIQCQNRTSHYCISFKDEKYDIEFCDNYCRERGYDIRAYEHRDIMRSKIKYYLYSPYFEEFFIMMIQFFNNYYQCEKKIDVCNKYNGRFVSCMLTDLLKVVENEPKYEKDFSFFYTILTTHYLFIDKIPILFINLKDVYLSVHFIFELKNKTEQKILDKETKWDKCKNGSDKIYNFFQSLLNVKTLEEAEFILTQPYECLHFHIDLNILDMNQKSETMKCFDSQQTKFFNYNPSCISFDN